MKDPWVKWFAGDFLHGVSELRPNEGWVYVIVLNLIYDNEGPWRFDLESLARRCRLRPTSTQKALDVLIQMKKLSLVDGFLTNAKAESSIKSRLKVRQNSVDAATERWKNSGKNHNENNVDVDAPAMRLQCDRNAIPEARSQKETTLLTREEPSDDWPEGKAFDHAKLLCEAVGTALLDLARSPGLVQSTARLHAWKRDGASWEHDVLPVVTARMQGRTQPVSSWSYFDAAIGESIAANRRALTIPEHTDVQRPDRGRPENPHDARRRAHLELLAEQGNAE